MAGYIPELSGYSGQGAFRYWCQKVLPLVYDDSLSYYELLNKIVVYLNNTIEDVAKAEGNIDSLLAAYTELKNDVDNYFNSLDVQEEINNKLDEMAEHDELSTLIEPFIPSLVTSWLTENVIIPEGGAVTLDPTLTSAVQAAPAKTVGDIFNNTIRFKRALTTNDILSGSDRTVTETGYYTMSITVSQVLFGVNAYGVFFNFRTDAATIEQLAIFTNGTAKVRYGYTGDFSDINGEILNELLNNSIRFKRALTTEDVLSGSNRTVTETGYYTMSIAVSEALFDVHAYGVFFNFKADTATVEQLAIFTNGKIKMRYGSTGDFIDIVDNTLSVSGLAADAKTVGDIFNNTIRFKRALTTNDILSGSDRTVTETGYYTMSITVSQVLFGVNAYGVFFNFRTDAATIEQLAIFTNGTAKVRYGYTGDFSDINGEILNELLNNSIRFKRALTTEDVLSGSNRTVTETGYYTMSIVVSEALFDVHAYGVFINFRTDGATIEQLAIFTDGTIKVRYGYTEDFHTLTTKDYTGKTFYYASPTLTSGADDSTGGAFAFYLPYGKKHVRIKLIHATRADYDGEGNPTYHNENVFRLSECMLGNLVNDTFVSERRIWTDGAVEAAYYKNNTGSAFGTYHGWEKFKDCVVIIDGNIVGNFTPQNVAVPDISFRECRKIEILYHSDVFQLPVVGVTTETKMIDVFRHYIIDANGIYINQKNTWLIAGNHGMFAGMGNVYRPSVNKGICDYDNVIYNVTEGVENNICGSDNAKDDVSWAMEFSDEYDISTSIVVYPPCKFYINNLTGTANKMYFKYAKSTEVGETWDNEAWYTFGGSIDDSKINKMVEKEKETAVYDTYITENVTGNPATFSDGADDIPVKSLVANIDTVQQGSGTPDVENPRLFTPINSMTLNLTGKNLYGNGDIEVPSDSGRTGFIALTQPLPPGTYTISARAHSEATSNARIRFFGSENTNSYLSAIAVFGNDITQRSKVTFTITKTAKYIRAYSANDDASSAGKSASILDIQIETGSNETEYKPYVVKKSITIPFETEIGGVYGGTLNVTTGELTITHGYKVFNGTESFGRAFTGAGQNPCFIGPTNCFADADVNQEAFCTLFDSGYIVSTSNDYGFQLYESSGSKNVKFRFENMPETTADMKALAQTWYNNGTPLAFVYQLATPIKYTLNKNEVRTLLGVNNIICDTGEVNVVYRADTKLYIQEHLS